MKISVALGLTLRVSQKSGDFVKPFVEFRDIEIPDEKIESARKEVKKVFKILEGLLFEEIKKYTDESN